MTKANSWPRDPRSIDEVLSEQDHVINRRQVVATCGLPELRRHLRAGRWVVRHPRVYLTHTGKPSWRQRAWAAILSVESAALGGRSAVYALGGKVDGKRYDDGPIHVVVSDERNVAVREGIVVQYCSHYEKRLGGGSPPRIRAEHAILDLASAEETVQGAVARLTEGQQNRLTTPDGLLAALSTRKNTRNYALLTEILEDLKQGTSSVLEREYLTNVERPHGLPTPERQAPTTVGRKGFRDADYPTWGVIVELDGRAWHDDAAARSRDLERDLDALVGASRRTARIGWSQATAQACSTAGKVGRLLAQGGWAGSVTACAEPGCTAVVAFRGI